MTRFKDPRIATLIRALEERFPDATVITEPIPDAGFFDECMVTVLNAPTRPVGVVSRFAHSIELEIWGDDPLPVLVDGVDPVQSAMYYADRLKKSVPSRRRRPSATARPPATGTSSRRSGTAASARRTS